MGYGGKGREEEEEEEENVLRRNMRRELRSVKERITGERDEFVSLESGASKVEETLTALNVIRSGKENLVKPRELACDTEVLTHVADFALEFAQQLRDDKMSDITPARLVVGLLGGFAGKDPPFRWAALGEQLCAPSSSGTMGCRRVVPRLTTVPAVGINPMLGPLEVGVKERAAGQRGPRGPRQKLGALERPDDLAGTDVGEGGKTEMDHNMDLMYQHLRRLTKDASLGDRTMFDRFLVNPDSFSETVENCFMLSFLVKQGRASLRPDEGSSASQAARMAVPGVQRAEHLKVGAARPPSAQEYADSGVVNSQFCMRLDYAQWMSLSQRLSAEKDVLANVRPPRCKDEKLKSLGRGAALDLSSSDAFDVARAGTTPSPNKRPRHVSPHVKSEKNKY